MAGSTVARSRRTETMPTTPSTNPEPPPIGNGARARAGTGGGGTWSLLAHLALALIAYVPLLSVEPGVVTSDTKTYLYLDPARFLSQVAFMWNPTVALGTVTHEYIGYLLPMGPFYAGLSAAHVPIWVAQRLWLGTILFAAAAGMLYLGRVLSLDGPGRFVAALAYMLSPYFLQYAGRISVILLPWAGLPWMVAFAVLALRRGGWRYPALFAVVVALVSGINATAILYVGLAPALWLVYAAAVEREGTWRQAVAAALRIGVLTVLCSLWWIAGLQVEAAYGVDVLKYTETIPSTSQTSTAAEVIRGLGYWYFYGGDRLGPWTASAVIFTQQIWLLVLSYLVPVVSFASAVLVRWRHRAYFVLLVVLGVVLSVGANPISHPTAVGGLLKAFMTDTTAGLALRSTDRATPLVLLGLAMLAGTGVTALWRRLPRTGLVTAAVIAGLVIANNPAVFNGDAEVSSTFKQPASLPSYEMAAIDHLNATHPGTRVLAIPGNDFAAYRWGNTVDTPQPAFLTRTFVTREQQVMGSMATADTLAAMDLPVQTGIEDWTGLAPMARLLSAGDVLVEYDQAYEHYGVPQPEILAQQLAKTPAGLSHPVSFGAPVPNVSSISTLDEQDLASAPNPTWPSPLVTYTVTHPRPMTRGESNAGAIVVAGDATGLQNLANSGLLDTGSAIYYSGTLDSHSSQLSELLKGGATLVVTDTNRKEAFRWDTLTANYGYTETPSQDVAKTTLSDSPIDLFPGAPAGARTVASYAGAVNVTASSYGNTVSYTPEDRAYAAIDGNPDTSWETGTFVPNPSGQWWQVQFTNPAATDHVTLTQPLTGTRKRWITRATLTFDGHSPVTVRLTAASRRPGGQVVTFPERTFRTLRVTIDATSDDQASPATASAVGLSEVAVPGEAVQEVIVMPTDLLAAAGARSLADRLDLSMSRQRVSPFPPRSDPETTITRQFTLPTARTFSLSGTASLSTLIPDDEIDRLLGVPGSTGSGVVAYSSGRLPGGLASTAGAAIDGNPATAWQPGFEASYQKGASLQYDLPSTLTFHHMNLQVIADGRPSVPKSISVTTETATGQVTATRDLTLPPIADSRTPGATTTVPLTFPAVTGRRIRVTVTGVRLEYTTNYYAESPTALPMGIAELGIPGLSIPPYPSTVPGVCQSNLVSIDGRPITVRVTGSTATALANGTLSVVPCGADASGITLSAGTHILQTAVAHRPSGVNCMAAADCNGWNIDQLTLDSAPGGGPEPTTSSGKVPAPSPGPAPKVVTGSRAIDSEHVAVSDAHGPFELVLGQSINAGWHAVATPRPGAPAGSHSVDLGPPELVDSFANGWPVTAGQLAALGVTGPHGTGGFDVELSWTPQERVWAALAISGVTVVVCAVLGFLPETWKKSLRRRKTDGATRGSRRGSRSDADRGSRSDVDRASRSDVDRASPRRGSRGRLPGAVRVSGPGTDRPELAPPWCAPAPRPGRRAMVAVVVLTGVVAGAISYPLVGLAAAVVVALALVVDRLRVVTAVLAVGFLVAAAASVVVGQWVHPLPESSNWPAAYSVASELTWTAVVFLGVDAVVETVRRVGARRRSEPGPECGAGP